MVSIRAFDSRGSSSNLDRSAKKQRGNMKRKIKLEELEDFFRVNAKKFLSKKTDKEELSGVGLISILEKEEKDNENRNI